MIPNYLVIWILCSRYVALSSADSSKPPKIVNFNVRSELEEDIPVSLVPTQTFLANENVPVWIQEDENPTKLTLIKNVMEELTPFTVYRDPKTCTAALYFHKQKQFHGTIGHHHFIRKLKYNPTTESVEPSEDTLFISPLKKHNENRLAENIEMITPRAGAQLTNWKNSLLKYPDTVYIETLVMINYDIVEKMNHDFVSIVTYVLTLFNSVDMLYSKMEMPNIKINIAGIIIATSSQSFSQFIKNSCYETSKNIFSVFEMNIYCALKATKSILDDYQTIPLQSYDIVVFLTRFRLFRYGTISTHRSRHMKTYVFGLSISPRPNVYRDSSKHIRISGISDPENLKCFPTVAHEIAHLLGVPHDGGPLWKEDGSCDAHLMKKDRSVCRQCLTFGGRTPEYLKLFFGSSDACIFHNKPRSLDSPPGPRLFWNADEQCKCYGFKAVYKLKKRFPVPNIFSTPLDCESRLKCVDEDNQVHDTTFHINGTPCDRKIIGKSSKVCWNNQCVPVQKDNICLIN